MFYVLTYVNPFNAIGNFRCHLNFTQLLNEQVAQLLPFFMDTT